MPPWFFSSSHVARARLALPFVEGTSATPINDSVVPAAIRTKHWALSKAGSWWTSAWGWKYTVDLPGFDPSLPDYKPIPSTPTKEWEGVMWTWVRNFANETDSLPSVSSTHLNGDPTLRQSIEHVTLVERGTGLRTYDIACRPNNVRIWPPFKLKDPWSPNGWERPGSIGCGGGCSWSKASWFMGLEYPTAGGPGNAIRVHADLPEQPDTRLDATLIETLRDGSKIAVPMSDSGAVGIGSYIGAVVDLASHAVTGKLRAGATSIAADAASIGSGTGTLITAMSYRRQQVAFFGEGGSGTSVRVVDLELGTTTVVPLLGELSLSTPVAAT